MPRGSKLTEMEKGIILALHKVGESHRKIAELIGRSKTVVTQFLKDPSSYGSAPKSGRRSKLTSSARRQVVRHAKHSKLSARELRNALNLDCTIRTVQRCLYDDETIVYSMRMRTSDLTPRRKEEWVRFAMEYVSRGPGWSDVVFTDENKFNLDGPDGLKMYWHNLRDKPEEFVSRQRGRGGVMVWAGFSLFGKTELAILEGNQDSETYIRTLLEYFLPFSH
ncbi:unnamed protein product, partial [Choristocarpus tenellus]